MQKDKLWTKDFIIVSLINFMLTLVFFLLMVTIAPYAVEEFHASTSSAGLISSIFIIGALIGRLITGRYIQNVGSKKVMMIGLILVIITTGLYFAAISIPLLMINRLFHGIAVGIASTATGTIIAQIIPSTRRGEGIGYFSMSAILATSIGPFVGILLSQVVDFKMIFLLNLIISVMILLVAFIVNAPTPLSTNAQVKKEKGFMLSNFLELKAIPISIVVLTVGFGYSSVLSFITFYAKDIHLVEAASFFYLVYAIVILLSRPFSGPLMDAKGANIIIYPCLFIFAIGMYLLSQAEHGFTLLLASAIIGLGFGNFQSVAQTICIKVTETHRLGLATSTYYVFYDLGLGVGPYLIGFLIPVIGFRHLYVMMVFVILASIVLYYFLHGKKDKELIQTSGNQAVLSEN
jgi:MFS family permease